MALVRWAFYEMPPVSNGNGNGNANGNGHGRWAPAMDLVETEDAFVLKADLPGLSEDDISLELQDSVLTLSGERRFEHEVKRDGYHRIERGSGSFARSLTLPDGVDPDAIAASFDRGVLEIRIPKPEAKKPRRLQIAVGDSRPAIEGSETETATAAA
jgi:HSP20 family protein